MVSVVSPGLYTEKEAEEGRIFKRTKPGESKGPRPVNYPVGKPLEVMLQQKFLCLLFQLILIKMVGDLVERKIN